MQKDPEFKFGDASLAYGKSLVSLGRTEEARTHLEKHVHRWRDPEGTCLLAQLEMESGLREQARSHVRAMLVDIDCLPEGNCQEKRPLASPRVSTAPKAALGTPPVRDKLRLTGKKAP